MKSERFRPLTAAQPPFVSVYLDDSRDTADAESQLEAVWRGLHRQLEGMGTAGDIVALVEDAVLRTRPAVGRQGRGVIATCKQVLINEHLPSPPPAPVLRVSDYPYILPLVEAGGPRPVYVFAAVDHIGADIAVHQGGSVRSESVDGGGYPVHKPVTAGWHGYGDLQRTTEEAVRMNVRAVADRLTELVDEVGPEVVFVCGEVRSRTDVVSALPERVAARVSQLHAGARGRRVEEPELVDLIDAEFERRRHAEIAEIAERFNSETARGSGIAVEGLASACAALRAGVVETLIVGELGDVTVVTGEDRTMVAPDADALSEFGEAPYRVARADEALPFAAITVGASLIRADDGFAPTEGIAALLRYPLGDTISDAGGPSRSISR